MATSYLEQIKEKVLEAKQDEVVRFEQILEDCVQDFKDTLPHPTAIVYVEYLQGQGINIKNFDTWISEQGFNVSEVKGVNAQLIISYQ
jgi:hypothetical protein